MAPKRARKSNAAAAAVQQQQEPDTAVPQQQGAPAQPLNMSQINVMAVAQQVASLMTEDPNSKLGEKIADRVLALVNQTVVPVLEKRIDEARIAPAGSSSSTVPSFNHYKNNSDLRSIQSYEDAGLKTLQTAAIHTDAVARCLRDVLATPSDANRSIGLEAIEILARLSEALAASCDVTQTCADPSVPKPLIAAVAFEAVEKDILKPHPKVLAGLRQVGEVEHSHSARQQLYSLAKARMPAQPNPSSSSNPGSSNPYNFMGGQPTAQGPEQGSWPAAFMAAMSQQGPYPNKTWFNSGGGGQGKNKPKQIQQS